MTLQHPGIIVGYAGFDLRTSASKSGALYQWATTSPFIIIFYAYCRQFAQLFPPGQASVNFLDHVFRSLKETVSRESECNKVDDLKDLDCGFFVYLSNQNVYFTVVKPVLIFVNLEFLFLFLMLAVRKHRLHSAHDRMTDMIMQNANTWCFVYKGLPLFILSLLGLIFSWSIPLIVLKFFSVYSKLPT